MTSWVAEEFDFHHTGLQIKGGQKNLKFSNIDLIFIKCWKKDLNIGISKKIRILLLQQVFKVVRVEVILFPNV